MAHILISGHCSECLWLNCCDWILHRDQFKCKNCISKKNYIDKLNGDKCEEPEPEEPKQPQLSKLDILDAIERLDELYHKECES